MARRRLVVSLTATVILALAGTARAATLSAGCTATTGDVPGLVGAVKAADDLPGPDTIELAAGCTYTLTTVDNDWYGPNGLPEISGDTTIDGNGATIARSAAPGTDPFRIFFVGADPTAPTTLDYVTPGAGALTLRRLTITNGLAHGGDPDAGGGGGGAGMGGAIFSQGTVVLDRVTLTANTAQGGSVPALSNYGGGAGMGRSGNGGDGGSFGNDRVCDPFCSSGEGAGAVGGGGGGASFTGAQGGFASPSAPGAGGGSATGLGGRGGGISIFAASGGEGGDGAGGGALNNGVGGGGGDGGGFGQGGHIAGGGGGVGGGGGEGTSSGSHFVSAGGGGFGGGGGGGSGTGGAGGFGGGGGRGDAGGGRSGFGGGFGGTTGAGGGAGLGGAIFNMQGRLTIVNSTLAGNSAIGGTDQVTDHGKGHGGGIFNLSGTVVATSSTFAGNTAADDGDAIYSLVYDASAPRSATITLHDSVLADGTGPTDLASSKTAYILPAPNLGTAVADVSDHDLVRTMAAREDGTITGTPLTSDPLLGPLQDNGGSTLTRAPRKGSPLLDAGSVSGLSTDQRGRARPAVLTGLAEPGDGTDIGAFELQPPSAVITSPANGATLAQGAPITAAFTCSADVVATVASCDGTTAPGAAIDTSTPGAHSFAVTATDSYGTRRTALAGYTVTAPTATSSAAPVVSKLKQTHRKWRRGTIKAHVSAAKRSPVGTVFSFDLSASASLSLAFTHKVTGHRSGKHCVAGRTKSHRCTRTVTAGTLRLTGAKAGHRKVAFAGRLSTKKRLSPGAYVLRLTATDAKGRHSATRTIAFTIART